MSFEREPIFAALFDLLKTITVSNGKKTGPWVTSSRRLLHWNDVDSAACPAMFLAQGNERHQTTVKGMADQVTLNARAYIYLNTPAPVVPGTILNPVLDQLQSLFPSAKVSDPGQGKQTLGGLVQHAIIGDEILTFEGTLGDREVAIVPFNMLVIASR